MRSSSVSSTPEHGRPDWLERLGAAAAYLLVALVATWPLAWHPRRLFGAPQGAGDPYLNLFTLGWDLQQLFDAPASWFNGAVFDAPIFHPARQTLAYTDHLLLQALLPRPSMRSGAIRCSATTSSSWRRWQQAPWRCGGTCGRSSTTPWHHWSAG
jgi:hypothetical protein